MLFNKDLYPTPEAVIEQWKPVLGFEGSYEISSFGNLKSLDRIVEGKNGSKRKILGIQQKPEITKKGYLRYTLSIKKKYSVRKLAHVLVALHFIDLDPLRNQVNHKDGNKRNNVVDNLEWVTPSENAKHAHETGLNNPKLYKNRRKILKGKPIKVVSISENRTLGFYISLVEASLATGISPVMISRFINNKTKKLRSGLAFYVCAKGQILPEKI